MPRGALDGRWNLIVKACQECNQLKSRLEDDISAITMQPDVTGKHASQDSRLREEAVRKGDGSRSHRSKKLVSQSREKDTVHGAIFPHLTFAFDYSSPPQLDDDRAFELAGYHIRAFHYWITYKSETRRGELWPGSFAPLSVVQKRDWGNDFMRGFQEMIANWNYRVRATGDGDFFKIVIRRSPDDLPLWAWALEWNCNFRVVGFYGSEEATQVAFDNLPRLLNHRLSTSPGSYVTFRIEKALSEVDDRLFSD